MSGEYDCNRWLTVAEAQALGYVVQHVIDGRVRSMLGDGGYLVVYGAPSYMNAAWRAYKSERDRAGATLPNTQEGRDL